MKSSDSRRLLRAPGGLPRLMGATGALAVLLFGQPSAAQLGSTNVPLPDVLLLVDNSGSFEHMIDGSNPEDSFNNPIYTGCPVTSTPPCTAALGGSPTNPPLFAQCLAGLQPLPTAPAAAGWTGAQGTVPNKWGTLIQALTGSVSPAYNCYAMSRNAVPGAGQSTGFLDQYTINLGGPSTLPYDFGYYLPYHRPLAYISGSGNSAQYCAYTPGSLPGASGGSFGLNPPVPGSGGNATDPGSISQQLFNFTYNSGPNVAPGETINGASNGCVFSQLNNGAIDGASSLMRFGLMTFDNDPAGGTGATFANPPTCNNTTTSDFAGMWSYYNGWENSSANAVLGWPSGCGTGVFELGARNAAAPPWEGRMIGFPTPDAPVNTVELNNILVQQTIEATRPYGGTPTAALLSDAEYYYWGDPAGPEATDPYVTGYCRDQYIILLTDGAPNEDLRPQCGTNAHGNGGPPAGQCPYDLPQNVAAAMYGAGPGTNGTDTFNSAWSGPSVTTYVIGFAVSQIDQAGQEQGIAGCEQLQQSGNFSKVCNTATGASAYLASNLTSSQYQQYQSCCSLQQIALAGSGGQTGAYFADTPADLNAAIGAVLGAISRKITTRSLPAFGTTANYSSTNNGSESLFVASFNAAVNPWRGDVNMEQLTCVASGASYAITETTVPSDDFQANLASTFGLGTRNFLVYSPPTGTATVPTTSGLTLRPFATQASTWAGPGDGLETNVGGASEYGNFGASATPITNALFGTTPGSNNALNINGTSCQDPVNRDYLTPSDCATVALDFAMAQLNLNPATGSDPAFTANAWNNLTQTSTIGPRVQFPLGGVLHSTPAVSSPPQALLRDDSYQSYSYDVQQFSPTRDPVLYVATTDGLLHAFDTVNSTVNEGSASPTIGISTAAPTNNELWAFIPPGVLPNLLGEYYDASSIILDGAPVVRDVVWERFNGTPPASCPGTPDTCWHTMLVAGFGGGGRGYYALDVTDPRPSAFTAYTSGSFSNLAKGAGQPAGPHFMWQLASSEPAAGWGAVTQELFGQQSGTPAIATIQYDPTCVGTTCNPREIGVAILPGGIDGNPTGQSCQRALQKAPTHYPNSADLSDPGFHSRPYVRQWAQKCYASDPGNGSASVAGRSVTIARVDTGQVLAVFARAATESVDVPSNLSSSVLIPTPFDSPMNGTPVPYPSELGSDAQRIFIGDADGTIWRIDVSSPNPAYWSASIFSDPYGPTTETGVCSGGPACPQVNDSQPISVNPVAALDDVGNVTLEFSTGDPGSYTNTYTIPGDTSGTTYPVINYVFATQEISTGTVTNPTQAQVNWFLKFTNGERVSGPTVVFNNTLYFTTFAPALGTTSATACAGGDPRIWGLDFEQAQSSPTFTTLNPANVLYPTAPPSPSTPGGNTAFGGIPRDFPGPDSLSDPPGVYTDPPDATGATTKGVVIPGVTVTYSPACLGAGQQSIPSTPMLTASVGHPPTGSNPNGTPVGLGNLRGGPSTGLPGTTLSNVGRTHLDSWAAIVE